MFRWYDDDHASFQYEQGNYMRVLCEWNDSERTLRLMRDPKGKQGAGRKLQAKLAGSREARPITLSDISTQVKF